MLAENGENGVMRAQKSQKVVETGPNSRNEGGKDPMVEIESLVGQIRRRSGYETDLLRLVTPTGS